MKHFLHILLIWVFLAVVGYSALAFCYSSFYPADFELVVKGWVSVFWVVASSLVTLLYSVNNKLIEG